MRLEIFRRINQGGTPLSAQDIRLAYYGESKTVTFIRLAGIYNHESAAAGRMLDSANEKFGFAQQVWVGDELECWSDWWGDKKIANGQTASEMFLWSISAAWYRELDQVLTNAGALRELKVQYHGAINEALDACCAQFQYQDLHPDQPELLPGLQELQTKFVPFFKRWFVLLAGVKGVNLPVTKHRFVAAAMGAAYHHNADEQNLTDVTWQNIVEMIRRPRTFELPESRGRWVGARGYRKQLEAIDKLMKDFLDSD